MAAVSAGLLSCRPMCCSILRNRYRTVFGWQTSRAAALAVDPSASIQAQSVDQNLPLVIGQDIQPGRYM
ncbi:hypothetical protein FHU29_004527 [Hoyosella altamirensis]|uniref:Uncharacterized protein n=1 Tax=Hoyosella altamirensis TaxID=616997 RepID=A0A839RSZ6_9ACTN|nr:hypothetical protein [Hoyosella altamirensis]MBB3040032.1 hypothetical protein [Hoyosella altamirensis]